MLEIVFDTKEIDAAFEALHSKSFRPFTKDTGSFIEKQIKGRMDKGLDVLGVPFNPLSKRYKKRKEQAGFWGLPVMTATSALRNSIHTAFGEEGLYTMVFGFHKPIKGLTDRTESMASIVAKHDPTRTFLGINDADTEWIIERFGKVFEPELA